MERHLQRGLCSALLLPLLLGACARSDDAAEVAPARLGQDFGSAHFLQFFNKQPSLAAGEYQLVAATASAGAAGSYSLEVIHDNGFTERHSGQWTSSSGPDPLGAGNVSHSLRLPLPGGVTATLRSADADAYLYLLDAQGRVLHEDDDGAGGSDARISLPVSQTNSEAYARAFYATVDPCNARETLHAWQQVNGFDQGHDVHVIFRDTKDLGYGRDMYARRQADGSYAFYVHNFQVRNAVPGQNYGPLNLDAAIAQDFAKYHIGTNAIEWGPVDTDGDCQPNDITGDGLIDARDFFTRHYTFDPGPVATRRLFVDLDGKGPKAMPVPCILCHGGRADPLLPEPQIPGIPESRFPRHGDTKARLQPLDVDSFEFSAQPGWTRAELEDSLRFLNQAVYESYAPLEEAAEGEWDSSMARELLESWYGGASAGVLLPNAFDDDYVPEGWRPDPADGSPPNGADLLYRELIAQNCRSCHLLRGSHQQSDIDFTSYAKFISYAPEVESLVFDRGMMPLAFLTFGHFWEREGLAEMLASFLPGFSRHDPVTGALLRPGRPIAKAGPDRRGPSPVTLVGSGSLFADQYAWELVSAPANAQASILDPAAPRAALVADLPGNYVVELKVARGGVWSTADTVTVTIDDSVVPAPADLRFTNDIKPVLQTDCVQCHAPAGHPSKTNAAFFPPVFYTDPLPGENRDLYAEVRARVDLLEPENSRLLLKPQGQHHAGQQRPGFDLSGDRSRYDLLLNWILEGAPED